MSTDDERAIHERLARSELPMAVYGLGKMGLSMAAVYAERSGNVTGVDIDTDVVATVNSGESHVKREPGLSELVGELVADESLSATTDAVEAARAAEVHVVIVPTQLDEHRTPDLSMVTAAVDTLGEGLAPGDAVFIESTVPPGTCCDVVVPRLEAASGLDRHEFHVAFCPERTSSGRALQDIRGAYPKIVGGVDEESTHVATAVYDYLIDNDVMPMSSATTAELVKLLEGVYRDVNIALANECARLADPLDVDVLEAISAANTQPFCDIHDPGPGVGGHCIPWYPYFIMGAVDMEMPLLRTAREVNDSMAPFTVERTLSELADTGRSAAESTVAVLGVTYRAGVEETRATPAGPIIEGLSTAGGTVLACDPMLDDETAFGAPLVDHETLSERDVDALVLVTPHDEFLSLDWDAFGDAVFVDGRDAVDDSPLRSYTIGRGQSDRAATRTLPSDPTPSDD